MPKTKLVTLGIVFVSMAAIVGCGNQTGGLSLPVVQAASGPSNATLQGAYTFSFSGFDDTNYVVAVGTIIFDGNGNITGGSETRTEQGGFQDIFSLSGSYAINADGTGTISMQFFGASVDTWSVAIAGNGQKIRMVNIEPNNFQNGAIIGEMEKQ